MRARRHMHEFGTTERHLGAVAIAFRSQTAVLYRRDPMDGKLARLDVARNGEGEVKGLQWPVDAAFSPDSRFVYVIDSGGRSGADGVRTGSVTVFRISEKGKLEFIEANTGESSCFSGARGIAIHPDGKTIVVTASSAGTLVVLDRDAKTGKTTVRQVLKDEEGDVHGLDGAMGVAVSQDGQFVYTSAGRFQGDSAVGVYKFDKAGKLALVQELMNGEEGLKHVLQILRDELESTMGLCGKPDIASIDRSVVGTVSPLASALG
ncbi:MAG: beta-propeller fold lactonase family protein [Chloroflexi bacterium]|nr:beta-propeller fold lactonase family protein [Chloroflexota bacterium]